MSSRSFREVSAVFLLHTVPNKIEVSSEANRMHCRLTTTEERLALEPLLVHLLELWSEYRVVYSTHELYFPLMKLGCGDVETQFYYQISINIVRFFVDGL